MDYGDSREGLYDALRRCGISPPTFHNWVRSEDAKQPKIIQSLAKIAKLFDCDLNWLLTGHGVSILRLIHLYMDENLPPLFRHTSMLSRWVTHFLERALRFNEFDSPFVSSVKSFSEIANRISYLGSDKDACKRAERKFSRDNEMQILYPQAVFDFFMGDDWLSGLCFDKPKFSVSEYQESWRFAYDCVEWVAGQANENDLFSENNSIMPILTGGSYADHFSIGAEIDRAFFREGWEMGECEAFTPEQRKMIKFFQRQIACVAASPGWAKHEYERILARLSDGVVDDE